MSDRCQESDLQRPTENARASAHATTTPLQSRSHWLASRMSGATPEGLANRAAHAAESGSETEALHHALLESIGPPHTEIHWMSAYMSSAPSALSASQQTSVSEAQSAAAYAPLQAEDLEILRRALAMTKVVPTEMEGTVVPDPSDVGPFAVADLAIDLDRSNSIANMVTDDDVDEHHAWMALRPSSVVLGWSAATIGAVLLVAVVRHAGDKPSSRLQSELPPAAAVGTVTATASVDAIAEDVTEATPPPATEMMADVVFYGSQTASPGIVLALGPPPVWQYPQVSSATVETAVIRGLPPDLSPERKMSDTDWEIEPAEDAFDVAPVVPEDWAEDVHGEIEFKSRDVEAEVVARLGLNGAEEIRPAPLTPATSTPTLLEAIRAPQSDMPEIAVQEQAYKTTDDSGPRREEARPPRSQPAAARKNNKASLAKPKPMNVGGAKGKLAYSKTAPAAKAAPVANPYPPPRGLFQFGPGGIKVSPSVKISGVQQPPPATSPAAPPTAASASASGVQNPDRPAGYETLETLGGGFMLGQP